MRFILLIALGFFAIPAIGQTNMLGQTRDTIELYHQKQKQTVKKSIADTGEEYDTVSFGEENPVTIAFFDVNYRCTRFKWQ